MHMVAVPLLFGRLTAADYDDEVAADPRIDALRARMVVSEHEPFTRDYYDAQLRHIGNAIQVFFSDGSSTERIAVDYPVGHRKRRTEGWPLMQQKFVQSVAAHYPQAQHAPIQALFADATKLDALPVQAFMAALVCNRS